MCRPPWPGTRTDLDAAAATLAAMALARCSQDNITVQLARIDALPPGPTHRARTTATCPARRRCRPHAFEGYTLLRELHHSARSQVWLATDDARASPGPEGARPGLQQTGRPRPLPAGGMGGPAHRPPRMCSSPPPANARTAPVRGAGHIEGQTLAQWMRDHPAPSWPPCALGADRRGLQAFHRAEMLHGRPAARRT
jgi:hypothetical protein